MTPKQRSLILEHLAHPGPGVVDAARIARVPLTDFEADWKRGRLEAQQGVESDEAVFYLSAQEAVATVRARLVAESHVAAGTREASDMLKLAEYLSEQADPFTDEDVGDVRAASPQLNLTERIAAENDSEERARMQSAMQAGTEALYSMWQEVLRQEARGRNDG